MRGLGWVVWLAGLLMLVLAAVLVPDRAAGATAPAASRLAARGMVAAATMAATVRPAATAECYRWNRVLRSGARGSDVANLQVRVAGWMTSHGVLAIDGVFGAGTAAAVARFQAGYGLHASGVADAATYAKIYALQDPDCTPAHFSLSELDNSAACGGGLAGGRVGPLEVRTNLRRLMWKLEALRHKLHDRQLTVTSGFRSVACNRRVGGASNSQHLYGTAADVVAPGVPLCTIAQAARAAGFSGILGPGAGGHNDHVHIDSRVENRHDNLRDGFFWSAPSCGFSAARPSGPAASTDV